MAFDPVQPVAKKARSGGEIVSAREPLLNGVHDSESYSVSAAILPFLFPALGGLLFGYDIGATSSATISIESPTLSGVSWYKLSSVEIGLLTSGSLYGALIGSVLAFNVADFLGRRKELIGSAVVYLVGALVTALAPNFPVLVLGRLVFGTGIGLAMHAAPMYIAETAPTPIRGQLISLKEFFIVLGMVAGYGIGSLFVETVAGWRYMYGVSSPMAIIMGLGMWWLPASPRWLLLRAIQGKGDVQNSKDIVIRSLCQLQGQAFNDSIPWQVDEILAELSYLGEEKEATFGELFQGKCLKALWIGAGLVLFQQITGQPSVLYYAGSIFQSAGFSGASDATRVSILLGVFKLIMTGVAVVVVDKLGRRPLLLGGVSGIVISLFFIYCPGEYPSPPPEYETCLGDLYSVAWMEDSDIHNLRTETLHQQYDLVKERTMNGNSIYGSHVMQYGDIGLSKNNLVLYLGTNPANDNFTFVHKNSLVPPSKAVNQRDADLIHFWDKFRKAPVGSSRKAAAEKEILEAMSHRMHIDDNMKLIGKLLFGIEKGPELLSSVRPAGQPLVDDWDCLKTLVRTFETHCGSLSQYGMKHMRSFANFCNAGIRKEQMAEASAQACVSIPASSWSSLHRGFSA